MRIGRYEDRGKGGRRKGYLYESNQKTKAKNNTPVKIDISKSHADTFFMAFDELFGILYIDLKILSGARE